MPLLVTDTGVVAVLGSLQDEAVIQHDDLLIINAGNSHTIAFHLVHGLIKGIFDHHTGLLNTATLDSLIIRLAQGVITTEEVYSAGGHGALVINGSDNNPFIAITGPRHGVAAGSSLQMHRAVPHGDIMLTGCYGLVEACALRMSNWREEIEAVLIKKT